MGHTQTAALADGLPEEEAARAATKIQAGFKGYKTRKELELEGKLPTTVSGAPTAGSNGSTGSGPTRDESSAARQGAPKS